MKKLLLALCFMVLLGGIFVAPVNAVPTQFQFVIGWDEDLDTRITGYRVHWRLETQAYSNDRSYVILGRTTTTAKSTELIGLPSDPSGIYLSLTTMYQNSAGEGLETGYSNEVQYTPEDLKEPPTNLTITITINIVVNP